MDCGWPLMVTLLSITSSPLVKLMVPLTAKLMVSPSLASASAWRNEPGPLSFRLVTVMMFAGARQIVRCANAMGSGICQSIKPGKTRLD
ncbi:MAG: hypothetical protein DMF26_20010 [Verrucomicrobia bacterium]|nr:MAG: hypothetical protein DMF26_20010 [Verrucomicrobiota bacterium]